MDSLQNAFENCSSLKLNIPQPNMYYYLKKTTKLLIVATSLIILSMVLIVEGMTCHCFGYSHLRSDCKSCQILHIDDPPCEPGIAFEPFFGSILMFVGVLMLSQWKQNFDEARILMEAEFR